jgi:hypothetical protein
MRMTAPSVMVRIDNLVAHYAGAGTWSPNPAGSPEYPAARAMHGPGPWQLEIFQSMRDGPPVGAAQLSRQARSLTSARTPVDRCGGPRGWSAPPRDTLPTPWQTSKAPPAAGVGPVWAARSPNNHNRISRTSARSAAERQNRKGTLWYSRNGSSGFHET